MQKSWGSTTDQLLLEAGYILFRLDNRGSANRSVAFKTAVDRKLGTVETKDQLEGVRFLRSLPYVDPARIGVSGWSYGGFMTLQLLTQKDAGFAAGASGAPPTDWSFYDTCYTERYAGNAAEQSHGLCGIRHRQSPGQPPWQAAAAQGYVRRQRHPRQHHPASAALQTRGVTFDMMEYPGERHGIKGNEKKLQLWRTYLEFFARNLGGSE